MSRPSGAHHHVDVILRAWPEGGIPGFVHAYTAVEAAIDGGKVPLPAMHA